MNYEAAVRELLSSLGTGRMPSTAYDTAWAARLMEIDRPLGSQAMLWLTDHQLPDGTWGAEAPLYYHDRVISTLAAMTALCKYGRRAQDRKQIERGQKALENLVRGATRGLQADPNAATIGFELIVPTLVAEAEAQGIIHDQRQRILGRLAGDRKRKLEILKGHRISRDITTAFSAEMAGTDQLGLLDADNLQEKNGSVACSPSATAFFALNVRPGDPAALEYLRQATALDGGAPNVFPFDFFEQLYSIWYLSLVYEPGSEIAVLFTPFLERVEKHWKPGRGLGFSSEYSIPDSDHTSFGYELLNRYRRSGSTPDFQCFETEHLIRTYQLELHPSTSINIHALNTLRRAGCKTDDTVVAKILQFMQAERGTSPYWFDKWHYSAYYPSVHMVIACAGWMNDLIRPTVEWLIATQKEDGSWGMGISTAEETGLALQGLSVWKLAGGEVLRGVIDRGAAWLEQHAEPPYHMLWIGKCLYCPERVVRATILSALILADRALH